MPGGPQSRTRRGILTRIPSRAVALAAALTVVTACAGARGFRSVSWPADSPLRVELLDAVVLPTVTSPPDGRRDRWFGSLSGLVRHPPSGRYLAVIDDRQPSRVAWIDITADGRRLSVRPGEVTSLRPGPGVDPRIVQGADLEAIVALDDGRWLVSEEGHEVTGLAGAGVWQPALFTLDSALTVTDVQSWPRRFSVGPDPGGVRNNQGFESLARTPNGRLIAGLEQPLVSDLPVTLRDGRPFGGGTGGPSRLIELVAAGGGWEPRREWVYSLEPTPMREGLEEICNDGENGLTDLLAIGETRLLALERACLRQPSTSTVRNAVRLYVADLSEATDVSPSAGAPLASARPVAKRLLLDFDTLIPVLPPALARLDNFEGLAFGPPLPDGRRTLIVMSDDNFNAAQHTAFIWLAME